MYIYANHFLYHIKLNPLFFAWFFERCKFHYLPQMAMKLYVDINIYLYILYILYVYHIYIYIYLPFYLNVTK